MSSTTTASLKDKEVRDLLRHIRGQKLDYNLFPSVSYSRIQSQTTGSFLSSSESNGSNSCNDANQDDNNDNIDCDAAWAYFEELDERSKFMLLFHLLNEKNFKTMVLSLLNLIKATENKLLNYSFICFNNHILSIFDASLESLGDDNMTSNISDFKVDSHPKNAERIVELDNVFSWNPSTSEYLLRNISLPSSCAGVDRFPVSVANFHIIASSLICSGSSQLGYHVRAILQEEMRCVSVQRTSHTTVEETIARQKQQQLLQDFGGSVLDNSLVGVKPLYPSQYPQYPNIIVFSLASFIASHILRGIEFFHHRHLVWVAESTLSTLLYQLPLPSGLPRFRVTSPEANCYYLQTHLSLHSLIDYSVDSCSNKSSSNTLFFSAKFVESYWNSAESDVDKCSILKHLGFLVDNVNANSTKNGKNKIKKVSSKKNSSFFIDNDENELLQKDFRKFVESISPPHHQERMPLLLSMSDDVMDDWIDLEQGTRDDESRQLLEASIKQHGRRNNFELWCLDEPYIGSFICEYTSLCPLEKLFSRSNWNVWSFATYQKLERKWLDDEAEKMLEDYEDASASAGGNGTSRPNSSNSKKSSKSKKKQKKSTKKKSILLLGEDGSSGNNDQNVALPSTVLPSEDFVPLKITEVTITSKVEANKKDEMFDSVKEIKSIENEKHVYDFIQTNSVEINVTSTSEKDISNESLFSSQHNEFIDNINCSSVGGNMSPLVSCVGGNMSPLVSCVSGNMSPLESSVGSNMSPLVSSVGSNMSSLVSCSTEKSSVDSPLKLSPPSNDCSSKVKKDDTPENVKTSLSDNISIVNNQNISIQDSVVCENILINEAVVSSATTDVHHRADLVLSLSKEVEVEVEEQEQEQEERSSVCHSYGSNISSDAVSTTDSETHRSMSTTSFSEDSSSTHCSQLNLNIPRTLTEMLSLDVTDMAIGLRNLADQRRPWQLATIDKIRYLTKTIWPNSTVDVFGSFSTGLAIPSSDIDMIISGVSANLQWYGGKLMTPMAILSHQLQNSVWVTTVKTIEKTAIPVIKITTAAVPIASNSLGAGAVRGIIKLDISFATPSVPYHHFGQHQGPVPTNIHQGIATRDFVLKLCAMNPMLVPLTLVIKQFLCENGLHDPYTGGLTSYAVTIMVAAILQPYVLEPPHTHPDLGTLLLIFFRKFGTKFDTRKYAVALTVNGPFVALRGARVGSQGYWNPPDPVVVVDPLNSHNNLGRSCFGFRQLQITFDNACEAAFSFLSQNNNPSLTARNSILGVIFGAGHHRSVIKLVSRLWCPNEIPDDSAKAVETLQSIQEGVSEINSNLDIDTDTDKKVKEDICRELLSQMNLSQLDEAHQYLLNILQSNQKSGI